MVGEGAGQWRRRRMKEVVVVGPWWADDGRSASI